MLGITDEAEVALTYLWERRNDGFITIPSSVLPAEAFLQLRDAEMIEAEFGMSLNAAFVHGLLPLGIEHFQKVQRQRRKFASLTDSSGELIGLLYLEMVAQQANQKNGSLTVYKDRIEDYRELDREGLLENSYADSSVWTCTITQKGISYVRGDFITEETAMNIEIKPVFTNNNTVTATSESSASAVTGDITVESVIEDIRNGELSGETKEELEDAIRAIGEAASNKDQSGFLSSLEKISSIAKNTASVGVKILPLVGELISKLLAS